MFVSHQLTGVRVGGVRAGKLTVEANYPDQVMTALVEQNLETRDDSPTSPPADDVTVRIVAEKVVVDLGFAELRVRRLETTTTLTAAELLNFNAALSQSLLRSLLPADFQQFLN